MYYFLGMVVMNPEVVGISWDFTTDNQINHWIAPNDQSLIIIEKSSDLGTCIPCVFFTFGPFLQLIKTKLLPQFWPGNFRTMTDLISILAIAVAMWLPCWTGQQHESQAKLREDPGNEFKLHFDMSVFCCDVDTDIIVVISVTWNIQCTFQGYR